MSFIIWPASATDMKRVWDVDLVDDVPEEVSSFMPLPARNITMAALAVHATTELTRKPRHPFTINRSLFGFILATATQFL